MNFQSSHPGALAALSTLVLGIFDWLVLTSLPLLGLSFAPVAFGLAGIVAIRLIFFAVFLASLVAAKALSGLFSRGRTRNITPTGQLHPALKIFWAFNGMILLCESYGLMVEPFWISTTQVQVAAPEFIPGRAMRIVHLTDLHVERITIRETQMIEKVRALQPDVIVLTGDYVNLDYLDDPLARADAHKVLSQLSAPYGVYAVAGSIDPSDVLDELLSGTQVRLLTDESLRLQFPGGDLNLLGVKLWRRESDSSVLRQLVEQSAPTDFNLLLYHTPDLAFVAQEAGVDLYLAGHTHGGQVRIPGYGALVTMSAFGKRFEAGKYDLSPTTMYVSRGLGMEGMGLPRVRFFCPPEIVLIELRPEAD